MYASVRNSGAAGKGFSVRSWTVYSSTILTSLIQVKLPRVTDLVAGSSTRSMVNFTASALKGSPLWNFTPWRSFSSQVVGLRLLMDVANPGPGL